MILFATVLTLCLLFYPTIDSCAFNHLGFTWILVFLRLLAPMAPPVALTTSTGSLGRQLILADGWVKLG